MKSKRYRKPDAALCREAVRKCFEHKWRRRDILLFIEEYAGIDRKLIIEESLGGEDLGAKAEAIENLALMLQGAIEDLTERGIEPDDIDQVKIRRRPDGMTGKERDIALLCIKHQLMGHAEKLMIEPLIRARLHPTQHASIPKRGQTKLKDQAHGYFNRKSLGITHIQKTDVVHAYQTLMYAVVVDILRREIPKAKEAIILMEYLGKLAPGGHLIIGGYLDAWLFNFAISYAITDLYSLTQTRRGKTTRRVIRVESYMDDLAIMTGSSKNITMAVNRLRKYCAENLGVDIRTTTGVMKLLPIEEEKRRKELPRPAQRGVPMLDMAGYRISRSHIKIRRRVFRKIRRAYMRAWTEYERTGTLSRKRAQAITSYFGYFKQSDSRKAKKKYHVDELMRIAKRVNWHYKLLEKRRREEQIYDLQRYRIEHKTFKGPYRVPAGE